MGVNRKRGAKRKEEDTPIYGCGLLWGEPHLSVLKIACYSLGDFLKGLLSAAVLQYPGKSNVRERFVFTRSPGCYPSWRGGLGGHSASTAFRWSQCICRIHRIKETGRKACCCSLPLHHLSSPGSQSRDRLTGGQVFLSP